MNANLHLAFRALSTAADHQQAAARRDLRIFRLPPYGKLHAQGQDATAAVAALAVPPEQLQRVLAATAEAT